MSEQKVTKKTHKSNRILFFIELVLAVLLTIACTIAGMANMLWISNDLYPYTADAMGHMTKVVYIAGELAQGHIPSWFPYWYNGSTVTQYYVPLSYYLMVPVYWLTDNVMLTYKIFCGSVMAVGGFGIWTFCYKKIGRFCGLFGIIAFCLQPILLETLYREGAVAQGPVIALMPWFLLVVLSFADKLKKRSFAGVIILTTLLILSHAMHAFMVCITTMLVLFIFVILKKIKMLNFILTGVCIVFAGLLTAFWSVVGSTQLENPGIPYLLPESANRFTATYHWFLPNDENGVMYFSIVILGVILISILIYIIAMLIKRNSDNQRFYGLACILLTVVTVIFSFGTNLPGFQYFPLASGMVPGRILTYTAVAGAITCAYGAAKLWNAAKFRVITILFSIVLITGIIYENNPYVNTYQGVSPDYYNTLGDALDGGSSSFDKGRYQWYGPLDSQETFIAMNKNINISNGWNIEGTLHNRVVYNNQIALPLKYYNYIEKQAAFWNIRYLLLSDEFSDFGIQLEKNLNFQKSEDNRGGYTFYTSNKPSSYFLTDKRNSLIISTGMQGFSIQFPNLIQGKSENLWDYTQKELMKYKLIYIIEPSITTQHQKTMFENMVTKLIDAGVTVMIEPKASNIFDLFDVHTANEFVDTTPYFKMTADCPYSLENSAITNNSNLRTIKSLYGLDKVYANFEFGDGKIKNAVLGTKKVGKGEALFVGTHLSQYLEAVYSRNLGIASLNNSVIKNSKFVEKVYSSIFSYYGVEEDYLPGTFDTVEKQEWNYQGGSFTYESDQAKEVTVSVTYTPRWQVTVDGKKIESGQCENLLTLDLPAGKHTVKLSYGITLYGKIGYLISAVGIFFFLILLLLWNRIMKPIENCALSLRRYFQFSEASSEVDQIEDIIEEVGEEVAATVMELPVVEETENKLQDNSDIQIENSQVSDTEEDSDYSHFIQKTVEENGIEVVIIETGEEEAKSIIKNQNDEALNKAIKPNIKDTTNEKSLSHQKPSRNNNSVKKKQIHFMEDKTVRKKNISEKNHAVTRNNMVGKKPELAKPSRIRRPNQKTITPGNVRNKKSEANLFLMEKLFLRLQTEQLKKKKRTSTSVNRNKKYKNYIVIPPNDRKKTK